MNNQINDIKEKRKELQERNNRNISLLEQMFAGFSDYIDYTKFRDMEQKADIITEFANASQTVMDCIRITIWEQLCTTDYDSEL